MWIAFCQEKDGKETLGFVETEATARLAAAWNYPRNESTNLCINVPF